MVFPEITKKKEKSRHECEVCKRRMEKGEYVVEYLSDCYYNKFKKRYSHLDCILKRSPQALPVIIRGRRDRIRREALLEAV
jgi:hypothetical protein